MLHMDPSIEQSLRIVIDPLLFLIHINHIPIFIYPLIYLQMVT